MPKLAKQTKRTMKAKSKRSVKRSASRSAVQRSAIPPGAQDVTDLDPDVLTGRIKLRCDNDTNVHMFRANGRLFMLTVERGGAQGTAPADAV
jgi:hypothetical protein